MPAGGARKGAGRPKGQGKFKGEPTQAIRLPVSMIASLQAGNTLPRPLPLYLSKISAGIPSPAESDIAENLDLSAHLIKHPADTFLVRVSGSSMIQAGIHENDILVVDRSLMPTEGKVVIAAIDGQLTVKRLKKRLDGKMHLAAENPDYPPVEIGEENDFMIWGVVTSVIHTL